ncbi:flagellar export chaperone FlgN [Rheinheimera sp. MMS21-TC3]|uniref:flagellar export chaperone FlgN n=1 Tax=Rheinheimera sp. MMS21-TC3 TaxID=3072790 RepID=UPI0028C488E7|nr:flagellar export chaperone FlgN [Rheinheimera sp. MMS21-TC3]WNO61843.1 flagellar export chaperone FlgN [Rheinheimera sp. MMS21-TC3]
MTTDQASTLLKQQQQQLDSLLLLLRQELAALSERDIANIERLTAEKNHLIAQIEQTDNAVAQLPNLADIKQLSWFSESVAKIDTVLADCKQQNEVNQQVLEQSQLILERFKNALLSQKGKSGLTYTNKGKPSVDNIGKGIKA